MGMLNPPTWGGKQFLAHIRTSALPYPSIPALCRLDTTHPWSRADPAYNSKRLKQYSAHLSVTKALTNLHLPLHVSSCLSALKRRMLIVKLSEACLAFGSLSNAVESWPSASFFFNEQGDWGIVKGRVNVEHTGEMLRDV